MSWAIPEEARNRSVANVSLTCVEDRSRVLSEAGSRGLLTVDLPAPGPAARGRLALLLESAIEQALERRGSAPPGMDASTDLDTSLSDQLYRARKVDASGLAIWLPRLIGIANLAGALDAEDSAVLRWWLRAAAERPLELFIDDRNRRLTVYDTPVELGSLLSPLSPSATGSPHRIAGATLRAPTTVPEVAASAAAARGEDTSDSWPSWDSPHDELESPIPTAQVASASRREMEQLDLDLSMLDDDVEPMLPPDVSDFCSVAPPEVEDCSEEEQPALELSAAASDSTQPDFAEPEGAEDDDESSRHRAPVDRSETTEAEAADTNADLPEQKRAAPDGLDGPQADSEPADDAGPDPTSLDADGSAVAPLTTTAHREWRSWMQELESARGPKPLAAVERMFVSKYVPLSDALHCGIADAEAGRVLEAWADSFARSYLEAFSALCVRGKRPTMVLDVPDIALRIGRLHGARTTQLLAVDGMRFDVGLRMHEHLRTLIGQQAVLTERLLLWTALPTTTSVQLGLIGRGPSGLRELDSITTDELPVARGRSATTIRRVKTGSREVLKLDVVEARMSEPGGPLTERLDAVARETAEAVANHFLKLSQRTLVMVFGDHGFSVSEEEGQTAAARQGGAQPEQVLVPAFAWLVGDVH